MKKDIEFDFELIKTAVEKATTTCMKSSLGLYELQSIANATYILLEDTNGFDSCDLAGFILNNSRKLGIALHAEGYVASDSLESAMSQANSVTVYS